jgi:hypothetical protein
MDTHGVSEFEKDERDIQGSRTRGDSPTAVDAEQTPPHGNLRDTALAVSVAGALMESVKRVSKGAALLDEDGVGTRSGLEPGSGRGRRRQRLACSNLGT